MPDYDSPWKEMLDAYFPDFMAFFFPEAANDIDWARGYESLDTELQQVVRDATLGTRLADKLMKVWRRDGAEQMVLIHAEIQGDRDTGFPKRMYVYATACLTVTTALWSAWPCWATPVRGGAPRAMSTACGAVASGSSFRSSSCGTTGKRWAELEAVIIRLRQWSWRTCKTGRRAVTLRGRGSCGWCGGCMSAATRGRTFWSCFDLSAGS